MKKSVEDYKDFLSKVKPLLPKDSYNELVSIVNENVSLTRKCFGLQKSNDNLSRKVYKFYNHELI